MNNSASKKFGLCDDPPPSTEPAYIAEVAPDSWIATVDNPTAKAVEFYAIDNCVILIQPNTVADKESTCDGLLRCGTDLTFVELKDRASSGWLTKGREQLTNTIRLFDLHHGRAAYPSVRAHVCNKQRPLANTGNGVQIQQFKDETGLLLLVEATIKL